jgi:hypothetical protein
MTDDIMTQLRKILSDTKPIFTKKVLEDAGNEIERLRADRKELLQIAKLFADEGMCRMYDEFGTCIHFDGVCEWHEAEHMWESFCFARGI